MRVVIAGASGFLGTHLSTHLRVQGHEVTALVRREPASAHESRWYPATGRLDPAVIGRADAVFQQQVGGGLIWASGDLVGLLFIGVAVVQWMQASEREAQREDRRLDRLEAAQNLP